MDFKAEIERIEEKYINGRDYLHEVIDIMLTIKKMHTKNNSINRDQIMKTILKQLDYDLCYKILTKLSELVSIQDHLKAKIIEYDSVLGECEKYVLEELPKTRELIISTYNLIHKIMTSGNKSMESVFEFIKVHEERIKKEEEALKNIVMPEPPKTIPVADEKIPVHNSKNKKGTNIIF